MMNTRKIVRHMVWMMVQAAFVSISFAQAAPQTAGFQKQMEQMRASLARNEQQLHSYQWIESTTLTIDGSSKPPKQAICRYAPDGTLKKTPIGPPQQAPKVGGGPIRRMIAEKKIEEFQEETTDIRALTARYLPMNQISLQESLRTHRVDFEHNGPTGNAIVIHDYAKPGDELRIVLDMATMRIERVAVKSYFEKPQDAFSATVDFSSLGDGTFYPGVMTVNAPSKKV